MTKIQITEPAKTDIQESYAWWSVVHEEGLSQSGVRQLLFGIGNRPTHRIVFRYAGDTDTVTILRVRHHSQDSL